MNWGYLTGTVLASLILPVILMIVLKLVPATKRRHGLVYGLCGALGAATPWVSIDRSSSLAASLIIAALFAVGYLRARSARP